MSVKIYEAYRIKDVDYERVFDEISVLKNKMLIKIEQDLLNRFISIVSRLKEENEKNGFIQGYDSPNGESKSSLIKLVNRYFKKELNLDIDNAFQLYKFNLCFFPNGKDLLFIPFFNNPEYKKIMNETLSNIEDYSYWDNVDAPYEEYKEGDLEYVSESDWKQRGIDWDKVLLNQKNSIPSLNGLQLNINLKTLFDLYQNLDKIPDEIRTYEVNLKPNIDKEEFLEIDKLNDRY